MWMLLMSVYINNRKVILFYFVFFLISWIYQLFSCPEKLEVHHHPRLAILALHTNVPDHYMNYTWSVITTTTTTSLMLINIPAGKVFSGSLVWILDGTHHSYTPCLWPAKPPIDQAQSYSLQEQDKGWVSEGGKKRQLVFLGHIVFMFAVSNVTEAEKKYEPRQQKKGKYVPLNVM